VLFNAAGAEVAAGLVAVEEVFPDHPAAVAEFRDLPEAVFPGHQWAVLLRSVVHPRHGRLVVPEVESAAEQGGRQVLRELAPPEAWVPVAAHRHVPVSDWVEEIVFPFSLGIDRQPGQPLESEAAQELEHDQGPESEVVPGHQHCRQHDRGLPRGSEQPWELVPPHCPVWEAGMQDPGFRVRVPVCRTDWPAGRKRLRVAAVISTTV
jgi:hypothetical protein